MKNPPPLTLEKIYDLARWAHEEASKGVSMMRDGAYSLTYFPNVRKQDRYCVAVNGIVQGNFGDVITAVRCFEEVRDAGVAEIKA